MPATGVLKRDHDGYRNAQKQEDLFEMLHHQKFYGVSVNCFWETTDIISTYFQLKSSLR